ncbi:MAG: CPBP family intramembrane metalloprotease [Actinobacteria bacterium]|nr:CPBP family intramembrane metalloprotease [Actinomycetota bacterium]
MSAHAEPARSNGRLAGWLVLVGTLAALGYAARLSGDGTPARDFLYTWTAFVGGAIQFGIMLAIVLALAAGGPVRELLGLGRPRSWKVAAALIVGILVGTLALGAALDPFLQAGKEQGLTPEGWDPERAAPFVANFVLVAGFVPIAEELTFRGIGYSLLGRFGTAVAVAGTAVLFGLAHGLVEALPILVAFGLGLAWLRRTTDSVVPCIVLHGIFNGIALLASVTLAGNGGG